MTPLLRDLACFATVLTACSGPQAPAHRQNDPAAAPLEPIAAEANTTVARMHERYQLAQRIELAVAWGQLDIARGLARELAAFVEPAASATWQPYYTSVSVSAGLVADADSLKSAAAATAELGARCASCHLAIDARPKTPVISQPEPGTAISPQMRSHQWAAAQLWTGLIGPDLDRWFAGAEALSNAPLSYVPRDPALAPQAAAHLAQLRTDANRAMTPLTPAERTVLFSDLLTTCASCHAITRDH